MQRIFLARTNAKIMCNQTTETYTQSEAARLFLVSFLIHYDRRRRLVFVPMELPVGFPSCSWNIGNKHVRLVKGNDIVNNLYLIRFSMIVRFKKKFFVKNFDVNDLSDTTINDSAKKAADYFNSLGKK
jgi:hypothetical protein